MTLRPGACASLALSALLLAPGARADHESGFAPEHGKMATADATPVPPGAAELEVAYAPTWSGGAWGAFDRGSSRTHSLSATVVTGVRDGIDASMSGGFGAALEPGASSRGTSDAEAALR